MRAYTRVFVTIYIYAHLHISASYTFKTHNILLYASYNGNKTSTQKTPLFKALAKKSRIASEAFREKNATRNIFIKQEAVSNPRLEDMKTFN